MSSIPPNLVGPILQTPFVQTQAAAARGVDDAQRVNAERRGTIAAAETDTTVETTDTDTQVFTDAEGSGSQGRAFSDETPEKPADQPPPPATDPNSGQILDLEA